MRRMNNLITLFTAMVAFFFGCFLSSMLNNVEKCLTHKSGISRMEPHPDIFLMILVATAPQNVNRRQKIRQTWLRLGQPLEMPYYPEDLIYLPKYTESGHLQMESVSDQSNRLTAYLNWFDNNLNNAESTRRLLRVKHFFAVGTDGMPAGLRAELDREQSLYGDMLLLPRLRDNFENLTEKMLHSIEVLTNHYEFSYLLKSDDDTYVKLDILLNELVSYDRKLVRKSKEYNGHPLPALYWGYFLGRANVKTKGKWGDPNYHLSTHYVTYAMGGGYVISHKICLHIATNTQLLSAYANEDVSMGLWLAPLRFVYRRHDPRFDTQYKPRKCRRYHIVLHKLDVEEMQQIDDGSVCVKGGKEDEKEDEQSKLIRPYFYDWTKPAEKCCDTVVK
ncbi:beta-1,3-galactosyltransferase 6 [Anastrepha ludens]|uniref:beta-1,3-galactosyltransferase 6 n=1 Tax=Anastrepha ludens TaxID=28586 RepID=UPI0023B0D486|nr:beta-1,3-galactosyltransferase 6 [Anastrepha ludens]XP_053961069.1 beta-1,3-galactosyltransferase 6 [Anastrepha ludens]